MMLSMLAGFDISSFYRIRPCCTSR